MTRVDFVLATPRSLLMLKPVNSIDNAKPHSVFTEQRGPGQSGFPCMCAEVHFALRALNTVGR